MRETEQLALWRGTFGDDYTERCVASADAVRGRMGVWAEILGRMQGRPPQSVLEVGCNEGINLRALQNLTKAELHAVEPNETARRRIVDGGVLPAERIHDAAAQDLPFADASIELVFTTGVLIHIHPDHMGAAVDEMHRVSGRWLLCAEYFSPRLESIEYRGREGFLFKRDFGRFFLERHPELVCRGYGFAWSADTSFDDVNWWVFEKP